MSIFKLSKKQPQQPVSSCCSVSGQTPSAPCCPSTEDQNILKVLGMGCASCHQQFENAKKAVQSMDIDLEVSYITDPETVFSYGVMQMPAIALGRKVISAGVVLSPAEVTSLLHNHGF